MLDRNKLKEFADDNFKFVTSIFSSSHRVFNPFGGLPFSSNSKSLSANSFSSVEPYFSCFFNLFNAEFPQVGHIWIFIFKCFEFEQVFILSERLVFLRVNRIFFLEHFRKRRNCCHPSIFYPLVIQWKPVITRSSGSIDQTCDIFRVDGYKAVFVTDHTGNQQGKGVTDCLIRLRLIISILSYWVFLNIELAD